MKVYRTDEIRNVVLLGHGGSGKTSLVEAMLYVSGATNRMGKIADSNTVSDFDKEEQKRGFSISTSLVPIEWEKAKINILDTPGYFDFVGEVEEAVSAADAAVIVVSGKAGSTGWNELCDKYNRPGYTVYLRRMRCRRRGSEELFPGCGKGTSGIGCERTSCRISGRGRESYPIRWILSSEQAPSDRTGKEIAARASEE